MQIYGHMNLAYILVDYISLDETVQPAACELKNYLMMAVGYDSHHCQPTCYGFLAVRLTSGRPVKQVFGPYSCYIEVMTVYICMYRCVRLCLVCLYSFDPIGRDVNPCPWGSGPCPCGSGPYPGPCGLVLVLVFSPCKDLFPLFHYSDLFAYYCSVNACIQLVLIILTYVFPAVICFAYINMMSMVLSCSSVIIIDIIRLITSMVIILRWLVFHLESSNENLK